MKPLVLTSWLIEDFIKSDFADLAVTFFHRFIWWPLAKQEQRSSRFWACPNSASTPSTIRPEKAARQIGMKRLILTIGLSGASKFVKAGLADVALRLDRQLAWGPPPSAAETVAFFAAPADQERHFHWHDYSPAWLLENAGAKGLGLLECFAECESVALWVDPEPSAQLILIWLLDYLRGHKELMSRLALGPAGLACRQLLVG